tara:strand:- start:7744 stop:8256 length:513 start_codon:yes stop_codon:yes gene_type:complete
MKLISHKSGNLPKKIQIKILKLKKEYWKYDLKSQSDWFKNNILINDIHNCLFFKKILAGYTCLRKRKLIQSKRKIPFLLFDTLIIKKKYQKNRFGKNIMKFNNKIIKKKNCPSYLLTTKKNISFYLKNDWKIINRSFTFKNHKVNKDKILMGFNLKKHKIKKKGRLTFVI